MDPGLKYISIDVEACANGRGHNDRTPCWVAAVDVNGQVLLNEVICVPNIYNPLTALTGLSREQILAGKHFDEVRASLIRLLCPHTTVLVGCHPQSDIDWMKLQLGTHFAASIDLAEILKVWNPRYENYLYFSLSKMAFGLLGKQIQDAAHVTAQDALSSLGS
eukprot:gene16433-biopygen25385